MPGADLVVMVWIVIDYNPSQGDVVSSNYDAIDEDPTVDEEEDADDVDGIIGAALYLSIYLLKNMLHNSSACQQGGTNYQEDKDNNNTWF